jgi:hypothetical protein
MTPNTEQPLTNLGSAPLPTAQTLKSRMSIPYQFTRFLAFDARIMRMVLKGHH